MTDGRRQRTEDTKGRDGPDAGRLGGWEAWMLGGYKAWMQEF